MIRRIVFTGDFLRPGADSWRPTQHFNIRWLRQLLGEPIRQATGLPIETVVWGRQSVLSDGIDGAAVHLIYDAFGAPRSTQGWACLYGAQTPPPAVETFLAGLFREALVIAFEMPPVLEACLRRIGAPYIDAINHPVRFLDDIFFGFRASTPEIGAGFARHAIREDWIRLSAGLQSASAQRLFAFDPTPGSALFLMQVTDDKSQIRDGRFVGARDFLPAIQKLAARHAKLYVKEHPLQPRSPHTASILTNCPNAEAVTENFYSLAATDQIATVASLSSSSTIEAEYFGKNACFLSEPPYRFARDGAPPSAEEYVGVFDAFLTPDFWRETLSPLVPTTATNGLRPPFKPNRLRTSLRSFWGFNEIDTDAVTVPTVRAALAPFERRLNAIERRAGVDPTKAPPPLPLDIRAQMRLKPRAQLRPDGAIAIARGEAGHVIFGPYLHLPPGRYRIRCDIAETTRKWRMGERSEARIEIALDAEEVVWAARLNEGALIDGVRRFEAHVEIGPAVGTRSVELRLWASAKTRLVVQTLRVEPG